MTASLITDLTQHPAFKKLSPTGLKALEGNIRLLQYEPGQPLSDKDIVPSEIVFIKEGQARLLIREKGQLKTLMRLGEGDIVGLASLLRADGCEEVAASTPVLAIAVSDTTILELFANEISFQNWQATFVELYALIEHQQEDNAKENKPVSDYFESLLEHSRLIEPTLEEVAEAINNDESIFVVSANGISVKFGEQLLVNEDIPNTQGPLPLRLLSLANIEAAENEKETAQKQDVKHAKVSARPPLRSGKYLGKGKRIEELQIVRGEGVLEEILACFQMLGGLMNLPFRQDSIEKIVRDALRRGQTPDMQLLGQLAISIGLHVVGTRVPSTIGTRLQTPALIKYKEGFALAIASNANGLQLASPKEGLIQFKSDELEQTFPEGISLLLLSRTNNTPDQRFDFGWFLPALKRHQNVLLQVLLASFIVQLFTLANPLLIQVIIDKVISQRSLDTLQVLGVALVAVTILEGILGSLRTFLFAETTNRIDIRLGSEVIDHLLRLPLNYFDKRSVGELGTRIAELEKIRNFLTGQALTTILDAAFSVIYILVMAFYSWILTLIALIVLPIQILITILGAPLFRRQYRQSAKENAKTQSHLVEVLTGIQTVKAQNVEVISRWKWQEMYHNYISRTFEKTITATTLTQTSQVLQKISQLMVLWVGAAQVLQGDLTLGQLIAFRIISGYVTQPLLRLSNIWQNIQELKVSFERLADVVDTPQESNEEDKRKIPLPAISGAVKFDNLSFRFESSASDILKNINLDIPAGTFVGVVGQSGSGKSTLMKLLPRLYEPNTGKIIIDGYDLDKVELYSLRRQVGIVPQDPLLFSGSVSENIALTRPDASNDSIVEAARLACAHEFIMELPVGYSSDVGERGAGLSGGQRQRIAIARTLLSNPKLLILDEATSALDYDTERRVCENLRKHSRGNTVFFITHRLSTIRNADKILMMHQGAIAEQGTHDELMKERGRYYSLFRQQEAN